MSIWVELYAAGGIAIGQIAATGHLRDVLETGGSLRLEGATWHPLDEGQPRSAGDVIVAPDDVHLATTEESADFPVHAQWHDIALEVGPYGVKGQMPTMPGFDPGRALARPTGQFVQLRDVSIALLGEPEESGLTRGMACVNRYMVDRVEADLMLGFFFPGAVMISTAPVEPTTSAGAPLPAAAAPSPHDVTTPVDAGATPPPDSGKATAVAATAPAATTAAETQPGSAPQSV